MTAHDPGLYARSFADVYNDWYGELHDVAAIAHTVRRRTSVGAMVAELGSGTGTVASGLVEAGLRVLALDVSAAMSSQDRSGSNRLVADIAAMPLADDSLDAAILAWNTLFTLTPVATQDAALRECSRALAGHGWLAIEAFIADPTASAGESRRPHPTHPGAELIIRTEPDPHDPMVIVGTHIEVLPDRRRERPWRLAYRSPAQLDQAAAAAGLLRADRFADWAGTPFDPGGDRHVSWYRPQ